MNKEKVLLLAVIAFVALVAVLDGRYRPVKVPATRAPEGIPQAPPSPPSWARRSEVPGQRSLLDAYSDLRDAELVVLPELPVPPVPVANPPVLPGPHLDAAAGMRHFFPDPPAPEEPESAESPEDGGSVEDRPGFDLAGTESGTEEEKPVDLATFDWLVYKGGLGNRAAGQIALLPEDARAGRVKYELLVDPGLEFLFTSVSARTGKPMGTARARERTEDLGFADTIENNFWSAWWRKFRSAKAKDPVALKELGRWVREEARKPKYDRLKGLEFAASCFRDALKAQPDRETVKELGEILREAQDLESEIQLYDWWIERRKMDAEVQAIRGTAFEQIGLRERARVDYEAALETWPDAKTRIRLAGIYLSTGSLEDARKAAEIYRRAAQDGERAAGAVGEARALLATGDLSGAESVLRRVPAGDQGPWWYLASGGMHYCRGDLSGALQHLEAARDRAAGDEHREARYTALNGIATVVARQAAALPEGDPQRASLLARSVTAAADALAEDPFNYYGPLVARGYALRAQGDRAGAVEALQEAVAALPREPYGHYLLAEFLLRDGRPAEARTHFLTTSRLAPAFPDGPAGVGRAAAGEPREAKDYLRRAVELEPRNSLWLLLTARAILNDDSLGESQRLEEARRTLATLVEQVNPKDALGHAYLGWVLYRQRNADPAVNHWNKARSLILPVRAGTPEETLDKWLVKAIQDVDRWQRTKIWRDDFDRPDGPTVGNLWTEKEGQGVRLSVEGGAVRFSGRYVADTRPSLSREYDGATILKGFLEVEVSPSEQGEVNLLFYYPQGKTFASLIGLRRTQDGRVLLLWKPDHRVKEADMAKEVPGLAWPADGKVSFGFVKTDEEKGILTLLFNGTPVEGYQNMEVQAFSKARPGKLRFEVSCDAMPGTQVDFKVEAVEAWQISK